MIIRIRPRPNVLNILTEQHWTFVQSWVLFSDVQLLGGQTCLTFCWTRLNFALTITHCARANWTILNISKNKGVAQHLFSEKFDRDQTSLNKTQQGWRRLNKVVKRSKHFALNKWSVLFSEMFSTFDWGLIPLRSTSQPGSQSLITASVSIWSPNEVLAARGNNFAPKALTSLTHTHVMNSQSRIYDVSLQDLMRPWARS